MGKVLRRVVALGFSPVFFLVVVPVVTLLWTIATPLVWVGQGLYLLSSGYLFHGDFWSRIDEPHFPQVCSTCAKWSWSTQENIFSCRMGHGHIRRSCPPFRLVWTDEVVGWMWKRYWYSTSPKQGSIPRPHTF